MPVATLLLVSWINAPDTSIRSLRGPLIKSFVWFFFPAAFRVGYHFIPEPDFTPGIVYFSGVIGDYFLWTLFTTLPAVLTFRKREERKPANLHVGYIVFFGLVLSLAAPLEIVMSSVTPGLYEIFYRPFLRLSMLLLFPLVITLAESVAGGGWALFVLPVFPLVAALVGLLSAWNRPFWAGTLTLTIVTASIITIWLFTSWKWKRTSRAVVSD